jgi:DNA-binding NtrC family response regulator
MTMNQRFHIESTLEITRNAAMLAVLQTIQRLASSNLSVLFTGEHGTGKEWAARLLHRLSAQSNGPFLPFDCASLPAETLDRELFGYETLTHDGIVVKHGAFEDASGGTLLLNEIDFLPMGTQMKIARSLEYGNIHRIDGVQNVSLNVRIISTLSNDHTVLVRSGQLSKEMFYRISTVAIELPSLRHRREDIPLLVDRFLADLRRHDPKSSLEIDAEALQMCIDCDWPGNIRQLKNAIEYGSIMCAAGIIGAWDLPSYVREQRSERDRENNGLSKRLKYRK